MKRRLTKLTAAGLAVLALTGCTGGVPEEVSEEPPVPKNVETTWTLVVGQPEGSTCWDAAESFAEALSDATEGAVAVEVQPMPLDRVTSLEQAAAGIVDLYLDSSFVYGSYGDEEELGRPFFSVTMPFLFPDAETAAEVLACPSTLYMTLMAAGALLMLVGGALSVQEGLYQLTVWRVDPAAEPVTYPIALLLCALFSFLSGPALLMLGRESYRGPITQKAGPWSLAQPAAGLAWLFATHLKHGTDPVLMDYGPALAAVAFLMLGSYELAALRYAHPHPRRGLFCCLMGVYLGLLSLGDSLEPFRLALAEAFLPSNLAGAMALLSHMGPVRSGGARLAPKKEINNEGDHNNGE